MKKEKHCFIIQKKVMAIDAKDAIKKEKDGIIIEVTLTTERGKELIPAIGFNAE